VNFIPTIRWLYVIGAAEPKVAVALAVVALWPSGGARMLVRNVLLSELRRVLTDLDPYGNV
jgi:hypothetical protein